MNKILNPDSVAIVGATDTEGKIGNIILRNISQNDTMTIYPINPKHDEIGGLKAYASVLDIEREVDLAIIAVPAKFVIQAVRDCAWKNSPIKNIVIISAGFSEESEEGAKREDELKQLAKENDLRIVGPNCLGVINTTENLNASFAGKNIAKGGVGLIMQSGALTTALFDMAAGGNFGFSLVTTLGNKAVVNENDLLDYYTRDEETKIIALYLEDIADGKSFAEKLAQTSKVKPVVVLKAGISKKAQAAILSHTGAMAGDAAVTKEAIEANGGIYCSNLQEFSGVISLLNSFSLPENEQIAIVTNAGGPGVVTTDIIESDSKLKMFEISPELREQIEGVLPSESSAKNPIDLLGDAMEDRYKTTLEILRGVHGIGAILVIVTPQAQTPIEEIAQVVIDANEELAIPVIPIFMGGVASYKAEQYLAKRGLSNFRFSYGAVRAIEKALEFANAKRSGRLGEKVDTSFADSVKKDVIIDKLQAEDRRVFYYDEADELGSKFGLNILPATYLVQNANEYTGEYPVVLKLDSPNILHKNAKDALFLYIKNQEELEEKRIQLAESFPGERMLVQPMIQSGLEVIIGIKENDLFGYVLMVGLGGIFTELLDTKLLWLLPASEDAIRRKIEGSMLGKILKKQKIDVGEVVLQSQRVAKLSMYNKEIKELDINPIMLYSEKEPMIVDIKILL